MSRKKKWIIGLLATAAVLISGAWLAIHLTLPILVRNQIVSILQRAGFNEIKVELSDVSFWKTDIATLSAGPDAAIRIGSATIRYSPLNAMNGKIDSVQIHDGRLVISLDNPPEFLSRGNGAPTTRPAQSEPFPVRSIELTSCTLVLDRGSSQLELPLKGTLLQTPSGESLLTVNASAGDAPVQLHGTIAQAGTTTLQGSATDVKLATLASLLPNPTQEAVGAVGGAFSINGSYLKAPTTMRSSATLEAGTLELAGQQFTRVRITAQTNDAKHLHISLAQVNWAGGRFTVDPVNIDLASGSFPTVVTVQHADLDRLLDIFARGKASGTGKIAGRLPVTIDWPHITFGNGVLESEGGGTLKLADSATLVGSSLGNVSQNEQQRIFQALQDFEFDHLEADFARTGGELLVQVKIRGRGRTGARQPLDITLNLRGFERSVNLYLQGRSSVLNLSR